ncbi:hypothetical protein PanWU01x14_362600 [Parasponia andersonii]|uniref:Uncharacterized protein n=1 Tax=Parasponia andersonii TaxID=3476 RepID=A0A2P5A6W6_PARAD|nr:hypothetical protein PanWU01x14_362600 [Parasponia andersonii]
MKTKYVQPQIFDSKYLFVLEISFHVGCSIIWILEARPSFPKWLQTQKNYSLLDISNAGISCPIPN